MSDTNDRMTHDEWYRERLAEARDECPVDVEVEAGDVVLVDRVEGLYDRMVGGYPVRGTVIGTEFRQLHEGPKNLYADAVIRVRFDEEAIDGAVYNGTTDIYPLGGRYPDTLADAGIVEIVHRADD